MFHYLVATPSHTVSSILSLSPQTHLGQSCADTRPVHPLPPQHLDPSTNSQSSPKVWKS